MKNIFLFLFIFSLHQISAQKKNSYKIIAYYTGNGETIQQFPFDKLTHIIYSFLRLQNDTLTFKNDKQKENLQKIVALKNKYPALKIMVSIGGWGGCAPCSDLFAKEVHRVNFAKTAVALFKQYNIDGLDLDWEYPAIEGYPGHKFSPEDKENFTQLILTLRKEMKNDFLLSFAAGGFSGFLEKSVDWNLIMPHIDFVNLMTYDLVSGFSTVTGHHTPLYNYRKGQQSTSFSVNWLLNKKNQSNKLIIGAAFYARVWENVPDINYGLYQEGKFKQSIPYKNFTSYFHDSTGFKYFWDKKAKAPFQYNPSQKLFATFDNKQSIRYKTKFIRRKKLGGIMFWELSQDLKENGLVEEISKDLKK